MAEACCCTISLSPELGSWSFMQGSEAMNEPAADFDQADEEILTATVSDEALEAAAGADDPPPLTNGSWVCC